MSDNRNGRSTGKARNRRIIKLAPMTRAVRSALTVSALTLAIGFTGTATAAAHSPVAVHALQVQRASIDLAPVVDLTVVNEAEALFAVHVPLAALAINETSTGDILIDNVDPIVENQPGNAVAISAYSTGGLVGITNQLGADLSVTSATGSAIGIYGYSTTGDVAIDNAADIGAYSAGGLADGIFASGANVSVSNAGAITASGYGWAAGIEAQAADVVSVNNSGDISVSADIASGQAFGLYATGNDVTVVNSGAIAATGFYATGIEAKSYGAISIDNSGAIQAGELIYTTDPITGDTTVTGGTALAIGINATTGGEGAAVNITNAGDIAVVGYYGSTGISAVSSGTGGTVNINNSGSISASQYTKYGVGAYGISSSSDGDSVVTNSGAITVDSAGAATGISSMSFAGNASIANTGDVVVSSTAAQGYNAIGLMAFSANGGAVVENGGNVSVTGKYSASAVDVGGMGDLGVLNSGTLYANGEKYAYGVRAISTAGDVVVTNADTGSIGFYSYGGRGFGILGVAYQGDVSISNAGTIEGYASSQAAGIFGVASLGDVTVANSGSITMKAGAGAAVGVFARADQGVAAIDNSGSIDVYSANNVTYGLFARSDYGIAYVRNSGSVIADGTYATGIRADGYSGATVVTTGGSIETFAVGNGVGIRANSANGDAVINNAASVSSGALAGYSAALVATSANGNAAVVNSGELLAVSMGEKATGIISYSLGGNATIGNSGTIAVYSQAADATGLSAYSAYGNVGIENSGYIVANSVAGSAIAIYGYAKTGDVGIHNTGDLSVESTNGLADGIFASGNNVSVDNAGAIQAIGATWAAGIEAQGANAVGVTNAGDITALSVPFVQVVDAAGNAVGSGSVKGQSFGIYATGGEGGASVGNSGNITVDGYYATGIEVQSAGDLVIDNSGNIVAGTGLHSYYDATTTNTYYYGAALAVGINATSNGEGAQVGVKNTGDISADAIFGATGISATASGIGGSATVVNTGDIMAKQYIHQGAGAFGIVASADANAGVNNSGAITVTSGGTAYGVAALSFAGNAAIINSGDVSVTASGIPNAQYGAYGLLAFAGNGYASVNNSAAVSVINAPAADAPTRAIDAQGQQGVSVVNSGSLYTSGRNAYTVFAKSGGGDVVVNNAEAGEIGFYSFFGSGFGVLGISYSGDVAVLNHGTISGYAYGQASGVFAVATAGDAGVDNSGNITVQSGNSTAVGVFARADAGTATVINSGDISATSGKEPYPGTNAYGVLARGGYAQVVNSGDIKAMGYVNGTGIAASSVYGTVVSNSGGSITVGAAGLGIGINATSTQGDVTVGNAAGAHITATGGAAAVGVHAASVMGDVVINNAGTIHAGDSFKAAAILLEGLYGSNTVNNFAGGVISATGADGDAYAVVGSNVVETINNSGTILNALHLYAGNDVLNNKAGGVWDLVGSTHTDFGDGDDTINNAAGGKIIVGSGKFTMGAGNDVLVNAGAMTVGNGGVVSFGEGDDLANNAGLITLTGGSIQMGPGNDSFINGGAIQSIGSGNSIDVGAAGQFTNNGLLSFFNGATTDKLTITAGTVGGTGNISIDMNLANGTADQLVINGNMAGNAVQKVNVAFAGMPLTSHAAVEFANVSGTSVAGNFVGGQLIGYNAPANFLNVGLTVSSALNAGNTAADKFSVNIDVNGLNDTGTLAASAASGAAGVMNTQMGTFRQRLGVNPYGDQGKVLSAFVRSYTDHGDMRPGHTAANFGQAGHFNYNQASWGREVGVNANLFGNLHAGLVLGNADSRQRLADGGAGENRLSGTTVGGYATWYVPGGFYVDLSARKMAADIRSTSAAGVMTSRARTNALSVEAGYEWNVGSFNLVPQAQYTRTHVEDVKNFFGERVNFVSHGGTFTRARLGVELNTTIQAGDLRWTPYGSLNAIRDINGKSSYTVGNFNGSTDVRGSSAMAELGLGLQMGGFGFNIGANWTDGGAYKSFVGGQASVRFSW